MKAAAAVGMIGALAAGCADHPSGDSLRGRAGEPPAFAASSVEVKDVPIPMTAEASGEAFWVLPPRLENDIARRLCRPSRNMAFLSNSGGTPTLSTADVGTGMLTRHRGSRDGREDGGFPFSAYDGLVQAAAASYDLDWLLISALIFHESGFDPCRASSAGAVGLMQVLPATARDLGIFDPWEPRQNIEAGVRYFRRMYDAFGRFEEIDRVACAVASYCAGLGHVLDACSLSAVDGLDPRRWANNVEETLARLSNPTYARRATYGGADGHQAVALANLVLLRWQQYTAEHRPKED